MEQNNEKNRKRAAAIKRAATRRKNLEIRNQRIVKQVQELMNSMRGKHYARLDVASHTVADMYALSPDYVKRIYVELCYSS